MLAGTFRRRTDRKPSMGRKIFLGLGSIAAILLLSGVISILEYRRMSDYVSELIASDINSINLSRKLSDIMEEYNHQMLAVVVQNDISIMPDFNLESFNSQADSLKNSFRSEHALPMVDSVDFDDGFYRSIIPGVVSVGAGLLLVFLLLYFAMVYYVWPINRISDGIDSYRTSGRRHGYVFDGDDQIANINEGVTELIEENLELKKRVKALKEDRGK